jgi:Na+/H+ antiporter NhaA
MPVGVRRWLAGDLAPGVVLLVATAVALTWANSPLLERDHEEDTMTRLTGTALRLTVFIGESDIWHHKPMFSGMVHRAHDA